MPIIVWLLERAFRSHNLDWEIVIVDDASPDGTQDIARQLQGVYGEDRVVRCALSSACPQLRGPPLAAHHGQG